MLKKEKTELVRLYENRLACHGVSAVTMGWRDKKQQSLRFKILSEIGDLKNKRILDVGCGFGDFYSYLINNNKKPIYTGYDLSGKIIEKAKKMHPRTKLEVRDITKEGISGKFDYIFESGILNKKISNNMTFAKKIIEMMYEHCRIGIGVNMMSTYVDFKKGFLFHYSPEEMFKFAKKMTKFVILRHDYPLYEFTMYIYKRI